MTVPDIKGGWTSGTATNDTIYALSTAAGRAGVAIVRISGPKACHALDLMTKGIRPSPRVAALRVLRHPDSMELIDNSLVLRFEAGASFTGEDVVELQTHGGAAVTAAVLEALSTIDGLRSANPGEFTRRAFDNGQLDLAQVEGLADLISAETEMQRRQALQIMGGALSEKAENWRADLIFALAMVEATIDWADEEVPEDVSPEVRSRLQSVCVDLDREIGGANAAHSLRDGFEVAIIGAPNVGKSSLINAISKRETSIISPLPGTTRDVIEVRCNVLGIPVTFLDTAGLRETDDMVERIGVDRARRRSAESDLRVMVKCSDVSEDGEIVDGSAPDLMFWNKADISAHAPSDAWIIGSASTGAGIDELIRRIADELKSRTSTSSLAANDRVLSCLRRGRKFTCDAIDALEVGRDSELVSEEIRGAIRSLEAIVGRVEADDMLDVVFSQFCMGK